MATDTVPWRPTKSTTWLFVAICLTSTAVIAQLITGLPIAFIALGTGAVVFALVRMPGMLFALYLLVPFFKGELQPYVPVDVTIVLAALNALQIVAVLLDPHPRRVSVAGLALWITMALLLLAGVLYAPDQQLALGDTVTYWILVVLPILPAALRVGWDPRYIRQFLWTFMGVGLLVVALGFPQLADPERLAVLGQNTIQTARAALLVPILGLLLVAPTSRSWVVRIVVLGASLVAVMIALASGSRGPLLVLVLLGVFGVARYLLHPRSVNWRVAGAVTGLVVATVLVATFAAEDLPGASTERFALLGEFVQQVVSGGGIASADSGDTSSEARVFLYGVAVDLFEEHPVMGAGTSAFKALGPTLLGPSQEDAYAHNAVLQIAADLGLVGVAVFGTLAVLALIRRLPRGTDATIVRVLFIFFLLNAMVSGDVFEDRTLWGLMMLVLLIDTGRIARHPTAPRHGTPEPVKGVSAKPSTVRSAA